MGGASKTPSGLKARQIALDWIFQVLQKNQSLDDVLAKGERDEIWQKLESRDKGFVRSLLMEALRRRGEVEVIIAEFLEKTPPRRSMVNEILLLGVVQLLFMEVSPYAAIDMSVRLAKSSDKSRHLAKLVNAVLRSISRKSETLRNSESGYLQNFPDWMIERWRGFYGDAATNDMCREMLKPAPLDLAVKDNPDAHVAALGGKLLLGNSVRLATGGAIPLIAGFDEGRWWVQDVSASLIVPLFGELDGKTALDLCAAPGGKTAGLIAAGANVTALDISPNRVARLNANLKRLNMEAEVIVEDIRTFTPETKFDAVLLDAPCSATGTIRRHPDILHLKTLGDVTKLQGVQAAMLERAVDFVKPGGTLIYCVCSLEMEEGDGVIEDLLARGNGVERLPIAANEIGDHAHWITDRGDVRLLPHYTPTGRPEDAGMDGFFISRLKVPS